MQRRRILNYLPILAAPLLLWGLARMAEPETPKPPPVLAPRPVRVPVRVDNVRVPPDVAELLRQGRHWAAARLLRDRVNAASEPGLVLLAARAEAGWGGWSNVRQGKQQREHDLAGRVDGDRRKGVIASPQESPADPLHHLLR
jgi:soluble lytic murein transglycosylase